MKSVTQLYLKSILSYDETTGQFTWLNRPDIRPSANARWRGKIASSNHSAGYLSIGIDGGHYLAHRLAWLYVYGEWPINLIDHIDGDKRNNCIGNLRVANKKQNGFNRGKNSNNTSGYKSVFYHKQSGRWTSRINANGKNRSLGMFGCPTAAHFAYCRAVKQYHGEYARTE